jgi:hypothetical protein
MGVSESEQVQAMLRRMSLEEKLAAVIALGRYYSGSIEKIILGEEHAKRQVNPRGYGKRCKHGYESY